MRGALDVSRAELGRLPRVDDDEIVALALTDTLFELRGREGETRIRVALLVQRHDPYRNSRGLSGSSLSVSSLVVGEGCSGRTYNFAFPSGVTKR